MTQKRLLEFYGTECPHCVHMTSLVERLEKEEGLEFQKIEVWHDAQNARMMDEYDKGYCGGVPFFYNTATNKWICGSVPYEALKTFALEG